jgi:hypothetical protein
MTGPTANKARPHDASHYTYDAETGLCDDCGAMVDPLAAPIAAALGPATRAFRLTQDRVSDDDEMDEMDVLDVCLTAALRAALAARTPQPAEDRCPSCEHRREFHSEPGCWFSVTSGTPGKVANCRCSVVDWLAPLPAVPDEPGTVPASILEGLVRRWDWTAGTLDDRAMAAGIYRCATDLRASISATAGDPWGGHVAPAVPDGEADQDST